MARTGRPSTFTEEIGERLIVGVTDTGVFDSHNAIANGIHPQTLISWIRAGLKVDAEDPLKTFAERYTKAKIAEEQKLIGYVKSAAQGPEDGQMRIRAGDWKAAAWLLERKFPKQWSPDRQPVSGPDGQIDVSAILQESSEQQGSLKELLENPPPELQEALLAAKDKLLQFLNTPELPEVSQTPKKD